ncbi:hypothetical protein BDV98DRAFT_217112 [Pterulicium gracile]|uniref:Uncharacterized protein n=1 Tax=Pterulicium gracile TaxID=1884261 RepID=A0A5C3Q8Y0_9AGAR|nr:hypothetical protein BDV98DRAFT_217112 [Pterula gracilis]
MRVPVSFALQLCRNEHSTLYHHMSALRAFLSHTPTCRLLPAAITLVVGNELYSVRSSAPHAHCPSTSDRTSLIGHGWIWAVTMALGQRLADGLPGHNPGPHANAVRFPEISGYTSLLCVGWTKTVAARATGPGLPQRDGEYHNMSITNSRSRLISPCHLGDGK